MNQLKIKQGRLVDTIHHTAQWGASGVWGSHPTETGVRRLALGDEDKKVRDWLVEEARLLGCEVKVDAVGNIFAIYPGKDNLQPPTGMGSHLDTQPTGGRYDGIYGVLSGLEVLRTMKDNNYVPNYPVALVDWTNEEGARFPVNTIASAVWAGLQTKEYAYDLESIYDTDRVTFGGELSRIGYKGETDASHVTNPLAAHFEIHIEQGPILEEENKKIGIVTGVQGYSWNRVIIKGIACHAGTTPMKSRADALEMAAKMILKGIEIAEGHGGQATIGTMSVEPSSINVIPERVEFSFDARHHEDAILKQIVEEAEAAFTAIGAYGKNGSKPLPVEFTNTMTSHSVKFDTNNIRTVKQAALALFKAEDVKEIISGAGHDSCNTSRVIPTSMIFIPSKNGISHNPEEYSSPEDVENGFKVLLETIIRYDQQRKEQSI
ncbi:uncharacterized protein KQ657_001269 [Scheffersomyces spartinae]|uniref:Peptidase M20 dimerisation domain-containing protein n=1 Tax=Scheffersomyces spartinae TaxID=45513 RepID=A0A9P7V7Q7_9ASCO|nr:uncharacterized protein KQ657_001269 [Scheffersomyces spartinae]KAG7192814.1 hypothetical protein KQ657_001269 [Scheffersomyces spartinae]